MVFRVYAWLYAWGSLLMVLRVQVQGIEYGSVINKMQADTLTTALLLRLLSG